MLVHYVRYPNFQGRGPSAQLYPICGPGTWEPARGWVRAPPESFITCLKCLVREHKTSWPSDYQLMVHVDA